MNVRALTVEVYVEGRLVERATLAGPIVYVGKLGTATLRLADINVSRKHAVIERRGDGSWWVTDLGSTNGTLLRGQRLTQAELAEGDRLTLGNTTLVIGFAAAVVADAKRGAVAAMPSRPTVAQAAPVPSSPSGSSSPSGPRTPPVSSAPSGPQLEVAFFEDGTFVAGRTFAGPQNVVMGPSAAADLQIPAAAFGAGDRTLARVVDGRLALDLALPGVQGQVTPAGAKRSEEHARWLARGAAGPLVAPFRARLVRGPYTLVIAYGAGAEASFATTMVPQKPESTNALLVSVIVHAALVLGVVNLPETLLYEARDPQGMRPRTAEAVHVRSLEAPKAETPTDPKDPSDSKTARVRLAPTPGAVAATTRTAAETAPPTRLANALAPRRPPNVTLDPTLTGDARAEAARAAARTTMIATELASPAMRSLLENPGPGLAPMMAALAGDAGTGMQFDPFGGTFDPSSDPNGGDDLHGPRGPGGPEDPGGPRGPALPIASDPIRGKPRGPATPDVPWHEPKIVHVGGPPVHVGGSGLPREVVENYIRRQLGSVKACYQQALQQNPKLGGRLTLAFTILPSGAVARPTVIDSSLGDAGLHGCIATKVGRWQFPRPDDDSTVDVTYPVLLKTQ